MKQVEYVPVPESSCALNVSNITCKSNPLHESLNIPESSIGQNRAKGIYLNQISYLELGIPFLSALRSYDL